MKFSVHVSDVPFIVSGERVGILDPHMVFIGNMDKGQTGKNIKLSEFSKFADQVAPFVDLFGFDQSTKDYDGTLFRFPFRRNDHSFHSKISDKCYTSEEVILELYSSLRDEASHILLFLKCIERIELYTWDHTVNAQKLYLQIELEPDCVPRVRELRQMCMDHCKDEVSFTAMGSFNVQVTAADSSDPKQSSWLVCNTVGSSDRHVLSLASTLKVLPWCGIAAPLPHGAECQNCSFSGLVRPGVRAKDIAQGLLSQQNCFKAVVGNWEVALKQNEEYAFCFLPLNDPTGLPVCIHGYFRVASNRRSIEWPGAYSTGVSAMWNKHLMEALVVPSYAILLASKHYLLSYFVTPALAPVVGVPDPYSWLPLPQEVKHSEMWRHLLEAKPSVQSLLTASPVWWTAADGGKWVKPDAAYLVSDAVPARVTKLLITLNCPVVSLPHSVEECFCFGEIDSPFQYVDQRYIRYQLRQNAETAALHLKDTALCLEVLDYVTSDLSPRQYSDLEGLPVIPLARPASVPRCLQRKQAIATEELVYIVTDDLTRSILPGLDNRLLSYTLPPQIHEVFLRIADSNQFCLTKVTPHIVCPGLIEKSMKTWNAQPGHSVLWVPKHEKKGETDPTTYAHSVSLMPEHKWLTNLWEWFRSQKEVSLANIKHLPIVPMVAVSSSALEQVQLCPMKALGTSLRQPTTAVSQQIADVIEELGCTLVPHSHIFIGHEDTLNLYLPPVSPLSLLRVLKDIHNASQLVKSLSTRNKDFLRGYFLENIAAMNTLDLAFFRSLVLFKTFTYEYVSLRNLHSIIFPPLSLSITEDVSLPSNILCVPVKDYDEYRVLLGREPETVNTFIISYVAPFALSECSDTDRNKIFLWILQQLRVSQDKSLFKYLTKTAFLPSNSGDSLYCPQALYDPEDEFLKLMFEESESAFPNSKFHSYLVELKDLGLQTRHELQRNSKAFQAFIVDRAHAVIQFDPAKASQCSRHILKALCDDADRSKSTRLSNQLRDIPFLFCQPSPPESYPAGLAWAGAAVEVPVAPSSLCASKDQQRLGHLVGSVSPVLSHRYKRVYNEQVFKWFFKDMSVDIVCRHYKNVVALDSRTLSDNAASVTKVMESVYLFLQQTKDDVNLAPRYIWHESHKVFLPLEKVAWVGINGYPLVPYRYTIQDIPGAYRYHQLWKVLGVQKELGPQDVLQVLSELQGHLVASKEALSDDEISMVIQILKFLQSKGNTDQVLMPTVKRTLLPAIACTYDDRELTSNKQKLLDSKGIVFTHTDVSKDLAQHFKVPPVTSKIARPKGLKIKCEKAGQGIELTRRIGNIIKDYEDSIDVFKELIQNADDAGATEVKFLIDWRQHGVDQLFNNEMRHWQGPALYAYNNSVFSPEDFENIRKVEAGTKLADPTKIGRFGLGFCSVYQLTDVPSFLSANKLVVFDPHMHFLGASLASGSPGISIDFVEEQDDIKIFYQDQVAPFHNVFGCNILAKPVEGGFPGTLFRLPFRGISTPRSDISSKTFNRDGIELWKERFKETAQSLLIFLRYVKLVGLYELESGGNPTENMKEVCVISCEHETDMFVPRDLVEEYHRDPDGVGSGRYSLALKNVSVYEPSVTKKGKPERERHEQRWLVASVIGSENSYTFARSSYGIDNGLLPLAEVAVKMDGDRTALIPQPCDGQLFCFLPLPITCDVKFLINSFFEVSSNRRHLKDLQDRSKKNVWNRHLITDCLSRAVLWMFRGLQQCHPVDSVSPAFLESYYRLFPVDATDSVSKELKPNLLTQLKKDNPFFHVTSKGEQCWKNRLETHVLQQDFHSECFAEAFPDIMHIMTEVMGLSIAANVPQPVQNALKDLLQIVSPRQYCKKFFIPQLQLIERGCRERQIVFMLKNLTVLDGKDRWLELLLKRSQCIPTAPIGTLVKPTQLIDPCGPLQVLFDECEERFPAPQLRCDEVQSVLRMLGMCHGVLNGEDVVDRARSIVNLSGSDIDTAPSRSEKLLLYISTHVNHDVPSLSEIPFIPVMKRPDGVGVPWKATDAGLQLSCASEMYKEGCNLVFTNDLILDPNLLHLQIPSKVLEFKTEPTLKQVVLHLKNLSKWASGSVLSTTDKTFLTDTTGEVYIYLETQLRKHADDEESVGRTILQYLEADKYAVVWDENTGMFLKTDMLALQLPKNVSLAPYRLSASEVPALKKVTRLWKVLGICDIYTPDDCIAVLHEMPTPLTTNDVTITVNILRYLSELEDPTVREHVLLPTTKQILLPPSKCYYDDLPWKQQAQRKHLLDKYDFVDTNSVSKNMAQRFGVQPISAKIANPTRLKIKYEEKGQQIPLSRRINRILQEYNEVDDVFKELIQNADDAEASVIKFLIDWRQHKTENLLTPEMAPWQGPALYVYNDNTFSDQDFDNICELEGATKRRNPVKIGRFGVGFCSVYHLTDVPSFVSRSRLQLLDPLTKFLTDATSASSTGILFDFVKEQEALATFYADQIAPYDGIFGCKVLGAMEGFDGTLFRFPFRSEASELSQKVFQREQIDQLKDVLINQGDTLLVFLQHLRRIELYELCEGQDHTNPTLLVSLERDMGRTVNLLEQFKDAVEHGHWMRQCTTTQQFTLTKREVMLENIPSKKGRAVQSSTTWLVASAVGDSGSNLWKQACSVEGKERGDVPVAEVAVPIVDEGGGVLPKPLPTGQVFCFLPLPITISGQKCLINGYFDIDENRRNLARLQNEQKKDAWNQLLIRDALVMAYIALLKRLTERLPCNKDQCTQFFEGYYELWPVATASHPLSKELQAAFKKTLCHSDVPLLWSLAEGGKWLPVCKINCLDSFLYEALFDTVREEILDILVWQGHSMAELPHTIRMSLCSEPDASLTTVSFKYYCEEVLLQNLPHLRLDVRDNQLLFIMKHLGALKDANREEWLVELFTSTACVPCEPNHTLCCPTRVVFPEGLLHELFDVDEERFPSNAFSNVKQSLQELGMVVHKMREEDVLERAKAIHTLSAEKARQRCESFMQYLTTVHFVSEVKNTPYKWQEHMKNKLIEKLSDIPFLPVQQRPNGSTVPWHGDSVLFGSPREVYSARESDLLFTCKLSAHLPPDHDVGKLFLLREPTSDDVLHHISLIVKWAETEGTKITPQDETLLDRCMPALYEKLSTSMGCTKQAYILRTASSPQGAYEKCGTNVAASMGTTTAGSSSKEEALPWNETVVKELKDRLFIWQESNGIKRFHSPAQIVSDSRLNQSYFPYLVKLSSENAKYQRFFEKLGVECTLTRRKIAEVLEDIAQDFKEAEIKHRDDLMGFIAHVAEQQFHRDAGQDLIFYLPDEKGMMRDARKMAYPEGTESDFVPEALIHGLAHFVSNHIPKAAAKLLGVQDILANIMCHFEDNEYFTEEDFGQEEKICTRLNNILDQYPADVSIFQEFIQNADDAMATEIAFVIDHRYRFGEKSLFAHHNNWKSLQKMPALLVFNNRKFQEEDIQSIKKLGTGGKADATDKIGRFGIGFNVAYHVTDCPTLVSFGEGGLAENFCAFDPQLKHVPSRLGRQLPGARYRMKNMDGKNSSEHFPDQFAPFLTDVMPQMAQLCPGSFADLEAKWPQGYSVFRLPLTRVARYHIQETFSKTVEMKSQELLGCHMTLPHLRRLARDLTEQAPGMLLFLNHLKRISVFEVSDEGTILSQWTVEMRHSSDSQEKCSQFAAKVKSVYANLMGDGSNTKLLQNSFHTTYSVQLKTKRGPAGSPVGTPVNKKPEADDQSQSPLMLLSSMQLNIRKPMTLTDDTTTEELVPQQTESTWVISKRFGLSDIPKELLYNGCEERLFPLAGVAILVPESIETYDGSAFTGSLYSYLPLPVGTNIPAHINGHFWVDPSRKHLEGSSSTGKKGNPLGQWNATMIQEVASRAYVDAVVHCKEFVRNSKASCDWFNSLLLVQPTPSAVLDDFQFSKSVFQLMIEQECEVLIADAPTTEVEWLALTANADNTRKGWFFDGNSEVRRTLLSIGVNLVSGTLVPLLTSAYFTERKYCGEATAGLARKYLKQLASEDYKHVIKSALVPLLTFVLEDIESPEQCDVLNGLPLMLTKDDQLRLIDTDTPLFSLDYADLLPEYCMKDFVSPHLMVSTNLMDKLLKLHLVTAITPMCVADNIELPNKPVAELKDCNRELLNKLWHYIAKSISSTPDILNYFREVSIIPTSQSTVVSVNYCKTVLREYGSVTLLRKLQLPVLDFSWVCTVSDMTHTGACVKEKLAKESDTGEVLFVLQWQLAYHPETAVSVDHEVSEVDVNEFISFLMKDSQELHSHAATVRQLNIVKVITGEWRSLQRLGTVYALPEATPEEGLMDIHMNSSANIIVIDHKYSDFYKWMDTKVLDRHGFYLRIVIPHFQLLPLDAQLVHLRHMSEAEDLKELLPRLHDIRFIKDERRNGLQLASEYDDPAVEVLKEFLSSDRFPPEAWCDPSNLEILRLLKLNSVVTNDMWRDFASQVQGCKQNAFGKAKMLLEFLQKRAERVFAVRDVESDKVEETPEELLQFLDSITGICFVPCHFPSDIELLFQQLGINFHVPSCVYACFRHSLLCREDEEEAITCLLHEHQRIRASCVMPKTLLSQPIQNKTVDQIVSTLGMHRPSVSIVCQNLLRLASCAEQCNLSYRHETKDAVKRLQELFAHHYDFFARVHEQTLLTEISNQLEKEKCLFVPSGLSFRIAKGSEFTKATTIARPYAKYLPCVPSYLASPKYGNFLRAVGVRETISAKQYINILEALYGSNRSTDPNFIEDVSALYKDLVRLLENTEKAEAEACIQSNGKPIPLPSTNGKLLRADQLVLNDAEWLKGRLEQSSGYNFIMPPPPTSTGQVSLPPCLGVQPLSGLIVEELDKAAVLDRGNRCEAELKAEAAALVVEDTDKMENELVESCQYSSQFVSFIHSEEFQNGLRRMISHHFGGKPLSTDEAIEAIQRLNVKCVYAIKTFLRHRNNGRIADTKRDDVPCFLDEASDTKCLYVCFHPKSKHASNQQLLDTVVECITRMLGGNVNAMHLRAVLESCDPTTVEEILDANHVPAYKVQDETDSSLLQYQEGRATRVENDLELILTCNFREGDLVKYCGKDSRMVIARVGKVGSEMSEDGNYLFPPTLLLKLSPGSDGESEEKIMNSLLVCKFMSPQQLTRLRSVSAIQDDSDGHNSCSELSQEIDVLLELLCRSNKEHIACYFTGISDALTQFTTPQKFFAIERLLFQLHFDCVQRNSQPELFGEFVEVLKEIFAPHCTDEAFMQSLDSNIGRLLRPLTQPALSLQPKVKSHESYMELSSWSIPTELSSAGSHMYVGGSSYLGQVIPPAIPSAPICSTPQRRGRQNTGYYPVSPASGRLTTGGAYIWGGGNFRDFFSEVLDPESLTVVTPDSWATQEGG